MHQNERADIQEFEQQNLRRKDRVGHGQKAVGDPAQGRCVCHVQGQHAIHYGVFGEGQPRGIHFSPVQPIKGNIAPVEELAKEEDPQRIKTAEPSPAQPGEVFFLGFAVKDGVQQPAKEVDHFLYGIDGAPPKEQRCWLGKFNRHS